MKATDLMLGDYLSCWAGHPTKVVSIEYDYNEVNYIVWCREPNDLLSVRFMLDEIEPIPLTPEILEKNGFETKDNIEYVWKNIAEPFYSIIRYFKSVQKVEVTFSEDGIRENQVRIKCQYVHELQHALKLCGINKEIVL